MFKNVQNSGDCSKGSQKALATKRHLLETALTLFKSKGYEKTTMRDIAKAARVSLGSAYYYFKSKEEIVLTFYQFSLEKTLEYGDQIFKSNEPIEKKLNQFFEKKFDELKPLRKILKVIVVSSFDADNPMSPFSIQNKNKRTAVIKLFNEAIGRENLKVDSNLKPILGSLIWHIQMGLLCYWVFDNSENQINSQKLTQKTLKLFIKFMGFSSMPFINGFNQTFIDIFKLFGTVYERK